MSEDELQDLADDILSNGLLHPIVTHEGKILDGRNRLAACAMAGVKPRFEEWKNSGSATEWVISANLMRRHLTASQRAVIGHELLPLLANEAKQRQRLSKGRGKKGAREVSTFSGKASNAAARIAGANTRYVEQVKRISEKAPELIELLRSGDLRVPEAIRIANLDKTSAAAQALNFIKRTSGRNEIETPLPVCEFIHGLIAPNHRVRTILDPCAGNGNLTEPWKKCKVIDFEIKRGKDFFKHNRKINCDLVLCNPPFSTPENEGKKTNQVTLFLKKILEVTKPGTPVVLIATVMFRLDAGATSDRLQWMREQCPEISSIISLPRDTFADTHVHCEVLMFNFPKLKPHYFLDDQTAAKCRAESSGSGLKLVSA